MELYKPYSYRVDKDEIIAFADAWGKPAGSGMSQWVTFGNPRDAEGTPHAVCIKMEPFTKTETRFVVTANSLMGNMLNGERVLIVSTKPWANIGDPENVAEMRYGYKQLNSNLTFFVNDKNEPPQGKVFTTKWINKEQRQVELDQGTWLQPFTEYYITYRRLNVPATRKIDQTLQLYVIGTDSPDDGGEVNLQMPEKLMFAEAEELTLGGRTGVVVWDDA